MIEPLLQVVGLNLSFGAIQASRHLSFDVRPGEIHGLIGPNGAGKTTAINQLTGELHPDSGQVIFDGIDITRFPVHKRALMGLARSFQITAVFDHLTVTQNIALAVQAHKGHSYRFWSNADKDAQLIEPTLEALRMVGLEARAPEFASSLSHGEKRQLEVGMALAGKPKLLLLDEPMAGMGPGGTVELSHLIRDMKGQISILLVEHDMDVVFSLADRVTVLVYGEAIATGTPAEIRTNPLVREAYLGESL
ncbi:MAG: ABC transporter ATP-binding protein [Gammaproteobacteria bacterium]|nr:ABC transporter ATP-binding protein [Gammaproteobacteria bacterium]